MYFRVIAEMSAIGFCSMITKIPEELQFHKEVLDDFFTG